MHQKLLFLLFLSLFGWSAKMFGQIDSTTKSLWEEELAKRDPTQPINFGYKWIWAAVKTENTDSVLSVLQLDYVKKANWVEGMLAGAPSSNEVFVLPPIDGWTLISGWILPVPDYRQGTQDVKAFLDNLSRHFGEAQIFGNQSVSGSAFWMKSVNGKTVRLYCIGDGETVIEGVPTKVEAQWELIDTHSPEVNSELYWDRTVHPEAKHVLQVAQAWSVNPMTLEGRENVGGSGHLGRLKRK